MWDVEYAALPANQGGGVPAVGITDRGQVLRDKFSSTPVRTFPRSRRLIAPTGVSVADVWSTESCVSWTPARCPVGSWLWNIVSLEESGPRLRSLAIRTTLLIAGLSVGTT